MRKFVLATLVVCLLGFSSCTKPNGAVDSNPGGGDDSPGVEPGGPGDDTNPGDSSTRESGEKFTVYLINSEECKGKKKCDTCEEYACQAQASNIKGSIEKGLLANAEIKEVDSGSEEGKDLVTKYEIERVPALVMDKAVESEENFEKLKSTMTLKGDRYVVDYKALGAQFFLDETKRNEFEANAKTEKEELDKKLSALGDDNRKSLGIKDGDKPRLDYFVMSFCPYGNPADENASKIHNVFGDTVEVVPHYIFNLDDKNEDGYNALHGPQEAHQGVRELCVYKQNGLKDFFNFTLKSNEKLTSGNADEKWEEVANGLKLDIEKIKQCEEKEGLDIAKAEVEITDNTKVNSRGSISPVAASPTVLVNGEETGRSAKDIQKALCDAFGDNKPEGCSANIEEAEAGDGSC